MRIDNLIILYYHINNNDDDNCVKGFRIMEAEEYGLKINFDKKTWSWKNMRDIPFGIKNKIAMTNHEGPIGIYDIETNEGVNKMIHDIDEATKYNNDLY